VLLYGEQDFNKWLHICDLEEDWQRFLASSDADAHRYLTGALNTLNAIEAYARYEEHCRHVWLADWFDQRIPDCIDACDICTGWHHRDTESTEKKITQSAEVNDG
jgi:superfamily II DNA helicase RecQ